MTPCARRGIAWPFQMTSGHVISLLICKRSKTVPLHPIVGPAVYTYTYKYVLRTVAVLTVSLNSTCSYYYLQGLYLQGLYITATYSYCMSSTVLTVTVTYSLFYLQGYLQSRTILYNTILYHTIQVGIGRVFMGYIWGIDRV